MEWIYWLITQVIVLYYKISARRIDVAFISNCRDHKDLGRWGNHEFAPWTKYYWNGLVGQMMLISSLTGEIGGKTATTESVALACERFKNAARYAIAKGAKVILYAAATKRLPVWDELCREFPDIRFTLGDNFTGALLQKGIEDVIQRTGLNQKARILVIAPYGLLGRAAIHGLANKDYEVVVIGNPDSVERQQDLATMAQEFNLIIAKGFSDVGKVDLVVACNCADWANLTPERIDLIRMENKKLVVVDPCEPANLKYRVWQEVQDRVIRFDSGNGYSKHLRYALGPIAWKLNRMSEGLLWGCFCEAFILTHCLTKPAALQDETESQIVDLGEWYHVTQRQMSLMRSFIGQGVWQFSLPQPTCFNKVLEKFELDI